jgi:GntP family gluconate:H+ symporter
VAALVFGFLIFFDAGPVVFLPIISRWRARFGAPPVLRAAGAFAAMHALVPPHPGPVAAATSLDGDVGAVLLVNLPIVLVA